MRAIEDALTLRRPCCGNAIARDTWDGCAAVDCNACAVSFCGVCLGFFIKGNAHPHVDRCPKNTARGYFPPDEVIDAAHAELARSRLHALLQPVGRQPQLLREAVTDCAVHIRGVGLDPGEFMPQQADGGNEAAPQVRLYSVAGTLACTVATHAVALCLCGAGSA